MNDKSPCNEFEILMQEAFADPQVEPPQKLIEHFAICPACKLEWNELRAVLAAVRKAEQPLMQPTPELWNNIEALLPPSKEETRIVPVMEEASLLIWMARHLYIAALGFGLWLSLILGQPFFLKAMEELGLVFTASVMLQYGIFVAFFAFGALIALLAAPILVEQEAEGAKMVPLLGKFQSPKIHEISCWLLFLN